MQDLQKAIDQYIYSENGAEIVYGVQDVLGALADFVVDVHKKAAAYLLLAPTDAMAYDRIHAFPVQDYIIQKDKDRIAIRDDAGQIYLIRPIQDPKAQHTFAFHPLSAEDQEQCRGVLTAMLRST